VIKFSDSDKICEHREAHVIYILISGRSSRSFESKNKNKNESNQRQAGMGG
jgi:hypothetical protein